VRQLHNSGILRDLDDAEKALIQAESPEYRYVWGLPSDGSGSGFPRIARLALMRLHAIMTAVVQLQSLYAARVERGVDTPDSSSPAGQKAVEQMLLSWATWRYRHSYYDEPLLLRSFDGVEHGVIDLSDQAPCLAASSFMTVKDVPLNEDLVGVAINILPVSETRTVAAFSYAKKDQGSVRPLWTASWARPGMCRSTSCPSSY